MIHFNGENCSLKYILEFNFVNRIKARQSSRIQQYKQYVYNFKKKKGKARVYMYNQKIACVHVNTPIRARAFFFLQIIIASKSSRSNPVIDQSRV